MVLDSYVLLTAGPLVTSSYKLVMLRIRRGTSMSGVEFCARSKTLSSSVLFLITLKIPTGNFPTRGDGRLLMSAESRP